MSNTSIEMLEGQEGWGLDHDEASASYLVLTLRLRLNLVRFCLFCGKSLHEGPLDHILTSSCFVKTEKGENGSLEVQLHPEPNQKSGILNDTGWSDEEGKEEDKDTLLGDGLSGSKDSKPTKKFMNEIARERHCCSECPAFFHSSVSLDQHHRLMHSGEIKSFPCPTCSMQFPTLEELCKHSTSVSSGHQGGKVECFLCGLQVRSLPGHLETHVGERKHKCSHQGCNLTFVQKVSLTKHMESHEESRHKCDLCGERFFRAESVRNHLRKQHGQVETFRCTYCGEWFTDHNALRDHSKSEHSVANPGHQPCVLCGDIVPGSAVKKHFKDKHLNELKVEESPCQFCGALMNSLLMSQHMRNVHPDEVQDEFLEEPEMRELERIAEEVMTPRVGVRRKRGEESQEEGKGQKDTEEKIFEENINNSVSFTSDVSNCPHCDKTLPTGSLQHHLRSAHSQEANVKARTHGSPQQFACLLCGHKTKASWFKLIDHFQVHPNPEGAEVNCPEERGGCGRPFSDLIDLHKHYWTTHKKGVECSLCGMLVKSRAYMPGHMTGHSDAKALPCSFCPKSFKTKIQLDIHESRHTGQGKYECSICGKRFPQKGEVKNHEQQHGDERGYTCDHCGKSFARDAYLRIHMKVHAKRGEVPPKPARRKPPGPAKILALVSNSTAIYQENVLLECAAADI